MAETTRAERILWRRLDVVGHDACSLVERSDGWRVMGTAVFRHEEGPACLAYEVSSDREWRAREGNVQGWVGSRQVGHRISRNPDGTWSLDGRTVPDLDGCDHLDLGFTPATNVFQLRRAALEVGRAADVPVAWFDVPGDTLLRVGQRYERRTADTYWYESPQFEYFELLRVNAVGLVVEYPNLWQAEP